MTDKKNFLDLFAGAGGLSEGFIQAGFNPVAHVEKEKGACFTLKTRMVYHWMKKQGDLTNYYDYLNGKICRDILYDMAPPEVTASVINEEISEETVTQIFARIDKLLDGKKLDLIIGGPPCQAYSLIGRSRDKNRMRGDKRNFLYKYYEKFLKEYKPRFFVFENVTGLLSSKSEKGKFHLDNMINLFSDAGYETEYKLLAASDYGILQNRKRIIIVGSRDKKTGFYPEPEEWKPEDVFVKELLADLPHIKAGKGTFSPCPLKNYTGTYLKEAGIRTDSMPVTFHKARPHKKQDLKIYRIAVSKWNRKKERLDYNDLPEELKTHRNRQTFTDRFKVVAGDLPIAQTVVAHIEKDGHYYIHPDIKQNRSLTPREAARLQTFPDDYYFESATGVPGYTPAFRQIGNAVPVLMARKIRKKIWRFSDEKSQWNLFNKAKSTPYTYNRP